MKLNIVSIDMAVNGDLQISCGCFIKTCAGDEVRSFSGKERTLF